VGLGRKSADAPSGDDGTPLHTTPLIAGPDPIYGGTAAKLDFQYGNRTVMAFASYEVSLAAAEWEGHYRARNGPRVRTAYLTVTPPPLGNARLRFQAGAFPAHYGAPGPWGWGTFGPVLAVHGYGGIAALDYDLPDSKVLSLEYGISAVSEMPEELVRGTFTEWPEVGLSSVVNHAHAGISLKNKYFAKLHFAHADGRNLREYLDDVRVTSTDPATGSTVVDYEDHRDPDGSMLVAALELRWVEDPYGQLGVTPVYWNFDRALSVHDGIWWGLNWTAGGREMTRKTLGPVSQGTGQIAAISAEYNFSLSRMLAYPDPFDGNGRDLRVNLAFLPYWTLETDDPTHDGADGYYVGAYVEHVLLSWLSTTYRFYGESRDSVTFNTRAEPQRGRWSAFNASLGLALHSDWQSRDRIELAYSRYFYSQLADNNPVQPLDREVFTLGASLAF